MTMKKILYLGKDEKYIDAIEDRVRNFFFFEKYDHLGKNSLALKKILISSPALLIVDIYDNFINASKLTGLVRNHHEFKNIPILCIIKEGDQKELERLSLVGGVIYFIKSGDQDDAVYCIKTLLSPELVLDEKIAKAVFQEQTQLFDIVWINSITSSI